MICQNKKQGFTLVEMLIYVGILSVISTAIVSFALWSLSFNARVKAKNEVQNNVRRVAEMMAYEIRHASSIYTPTSILETHPGQLSIETALNPPLNESKTYKDFYVDGGVLYLKKEDSLSQALTSEKVRVNNLVFKRLASNGPTESVQVNLIIEYNNPSSRPELQAEANLTTTIALRAY